MKHELQNIIQGKGGTGEKNIIQQITSYLRTGKTTGIADATDEYTKHQEEERLITFINDHELWHTGILDDENKIGQGAEQKVYYFPEHGIVKR